MENLSEALDLSIVGIVGVFLSLTLFSVIIWVIKKIDERSRTGFRIKPLIEDHSIKAGYVPDELNDELIAVITAAVNETFSKPVVVRKINFLQKYEQTTWTATGRLNVMASHNFSKRD